MGDIMVELDTLCEKLPDDDNLKEACRRVYDTILLGPEPVYESELSEDLLSPEVLGRNPILHGSYLRTALDILVSEGFLKKRKARYSIK